MWYPCSVVIIIVIILLSLSQIFSNNNFVVCWRKSECRSHVHPLGLLRISRPPGSPVPGFPHCLCSHRGGEPGHDHHHQDQSQTPHPHVLFSQSLVLCWFLLFHHSYTQTLAEFGVEDRTVSFTGCITQFFSACMFAVAEAFVLAVMAYDWFVAICKPLLYTVVMSPKLCASLVACPYMWGVVSSLTLTCFLLELSFCGSNIINNFLCEHSVIVSVSCSDPFISQVLSFAIAVFSKVSSLAINLTTYISIFGTKDIIFLAVTYRVRRKSSYFTLCRIFFYFLFLH